MPRADRLAVLGLAALGCAVAACAWRSNGAAALELRAAELARRGAPAAVIERLREEPFAYFRMLAEPFELRVCREFSDVAASLPMVPVEGDAHVEQFAVTSGGYGLDDFDRGGFGPAVVDLVRYATSLHLTCAQVKFPCDADRLVQRFLQRYGEGLAASPGPTQAAPPPQASSSPAVVARLRQRVPSSPEAWMAAHERSLSRLAPEEERVMRKIWNDYARAGADPSELLSLGGLHSGMGSTTSKRALLRVRGDLLVEVRRGVLSDRRSCVWRGPPNEAVVLLVMSLLRRQMPHLYGFVLGESPAWLQSWDATYVELSLRDLANEAELGELVDDAAAQLAAPRAAGVLPQLMLSAQRPAQRAAFERTRSRIATFSRALASETLDAWRRFRHRAGAGE